MHDCARTLRKNSESIWFSRTTAESIADHQNRMTKRPSLDRCLTDDLSPFRGTSQAPYPTTHTAMFTVGDSARRRPETLMIYAVRRGSLLRSAATFFRFVKAMHQIHEGAGFHGVKALKSRRFHGVVRRSEIKSSLFLPFLSCFLNFFLNFYCIYADFGV